ncbi:MAG: hypothetical protein CSA07_04525 [Bacteroidia bacterium]|nr:MAG: hypothetical protein CSA07_04525 [Bacteroidia bacterium]
MIQRIQTLWWAVALILLVIFALLPFGSYSVPGGDYTLGLLGLRGLADGPVLFRVYPLAIIVLLSALLLLLCILSYRRRVLQLRLSVYAVVLLLGSLGLAAYYSSVAGAHLLGEGMHLDPMLALPLLAALFALLGLRGVKRDIAFLKRMDRLR